jgi:hypothetical protein
MRIPSRFRSRRFALMVAAAGLGGAIACDSFSCTTAAPTTESVSCTGASTIRVAQVGDATVPICFNPPTICVPVPEGAATVPVLLSMTGLTLREPGSCITCTQCGHLVLLANGMQNNMGSATTIDFDLGAEPSEYGTFTLDVEVISDPDPFLTGIGGGGLGGAGGYVSNGGPDAGIYGVPVLDIDGLPLVATVTITTAPSCSTVAMTCDGGTAEITDGGTDGSDASP